ncbi:RELT-like protein 1 [Pristis pectinata]|uniref:RELT-like protein 1 n=1 Tax=Pristis pectinata TaxID=685728 RepID=UPI00223CFB8F|nr:RELT-like protein 1 [Pristis pectinata]
MTAGASRAVGEVQRFVRGMEANVVRESWSFPDPLASQTFKEEQNQTKTNTGHPENIAFVLVPVFFLTGLLGLLICQVLAKKGYRCTTDRESVCEENVPEAEIDLHDASECNADTVGQMVHYIMKNPANAEALHAMLDNKLESPSSPNGPPSPVTPESPVTPLSPTGSPTKNNFQGHHLHTVGGAAGKSSCSRCTHRKSRNTREFRKSRPGEVTVLSVGRFRVTHVDPKTRSSNQKGLVPVPPEGASGEVNTTHLGVQEVLISPGKLDAKEETEALQ